MKFTGFGEQLTMQRFSKTLIRGFYDWSRNHASLAAGRRMFFGQSENALTDGCDTWHRDAALAFALTGLILAVPAATLPLVSVSRFGSEHTGLLFSGVRALWNGGMPTLGVWVLICGGVAPALLLVALADCSFRNASAGACRG
jgi:uncharacterized paraquat-inducible protein A